MALAFKALTCAPACSTTSESHKLNVRRTALSSARVLLPAKHQHTAVTSRRQTFRPCAAGENGAAASAELETLDKIKKLRVNTDKFPDVQFFRVEAIIRPWRLPDVVKELSRNGILGMTATSVLGVGVQGGTRERYAGTEHGVDNLVQKSKLEIVCFKTQVNTVVRLVAGSAYTGEIGDGKIFVVPVADVIRIRTAETGAVAERMEGGMSDMLGTIEPPDAY